MKFNDAIKKGHKSQSHDTEIFSVTVNLKCSLTVFIYIYIYTDIHSAKSIKQKLNIIFVLIFLSYLHAHSIFNLLLENLLIDYYYPKHSCIHEKCIFCIKMGTDLPLKILSNISRFQQSHSGLYIKDKSLFG